MLKASAGNNIVLGLTERNLTLLRKGRPMKVDLADLGLGDLTIFIVYGKSEETLRDDVLEMIGPDTIYVDKRNPQ